MASVTDICNLAIVARLGQAQIANTSEDSNEARNAALFYPLARAFVNADGVWRHGKTIATLAEATNDREDDWAYAYERPSDCLRIRFVLGSTGTFSRQVSIPYEVFGDLIYCDEPDARLVYQTDVTDTTKFSPSFVNALSWYLAHLLVQPLKLSMKDMGDTLSGYQIARSHALAFDAAEEIVQPNLTEASPDWMTARY